MVFNNTKVLPAELSGWRPARHQESEPVRVFLTLIERLSGQSWKALARPARRLRDGDGIVFQRNHSRPALILREKRDNGEVVVEAEPGEQLEAIMLTHGRPPLPPYIARSRPTDERDRTDYQTVYAEKDGAVAAPTAGLHFTPELLSRLAARGVLSVFVTLHVGAGTFLPMKAEKVDDHALHAEWCEIDEEAAEAINKGHARGNRVVAVGTTSLRLLESVSKEDGTVKPYSGYTSLFIKPGYRFRCADMLLTNFHLPKSTLFMLVCAFAGTSLMKQAYAHALASGFRFYSYGDASLLHRATGPQSL